MARTLVPLAIGFALVLPASASQPGQPLDCSDWVFLEPGLSCSVFIQDCYGGQAPSGDELPWGQWCHGGRTAVDAQGWWYTVRGWETGALCGSRKIRRTELARKNGQTGSVVAFVEDRCNPDGTIDLVRPQSVQTFPALADQDFGALSEFDQGAGSVHLPLMSSCEVWASGGSCTSYGSKPKTWMASLSGFMTTFEILQTYTPSTNTLGFRVPYTPEGLPAAHHFDTYYGALTNPIDFTQAQPLQCGYPANPPSVGEYLTVTDPLPNPPPGSGRYYVTAVSYQGQRRYGRQRVGEVLSGRDPGLLPLCAEP